MQNKRLDYVDVCKAIGIILVVLGHTFYFPQVVYNLIYSFHMPLFFILAGFTFNAEKNAGMKVCVFIRKKTKELLLPYFVFAVINLLIYYFWHELYLGEQVEASF